MLESELEALLLCVMVEASRARNESRGFNLKLRHTVTNDERTCALRFAQAPAAPGQTESAMRLDG